MSSSARPRGARTATTARTSFAIMLDVATLLRERLEQQALNTPVGKIRRRAWCMQGNGQAVTEHVLFHRMMESGGCGVWSVDDSWDCGVDFLRPE